MKKILVILIALTVFCFSVSLAEDLSSLSDAELLDLYLGAAEELESRGIARPDADAADTFDSIPRFATFADAMNAADEFASAGGDGENLVCVLETGGKYVRVVVQLDDHAKELYKAADNAEGPDYEKAMMLFGTYAWKIPVSRTEVITAVPLSVQELDALSGKSVGELQDEGFSVWERDGQEHPETVTLVRGFYAYDFDTDVPASPDKKDQKDLPGRIVKNGRFAGFSFLATRSDLRADGTFEPLPEPDLLADEGADTGSALSLEEYTRNAWPFAAEDSAALLADPKARSGQVYMVKGPVMEMLSADPLRIVIDAGGDGSPLPVVAEFPVQGGAEPEPGSVWKFYGEFSAVENGMPVLTARWCFSE